MSHLFLKGEEVKAFVVLKKEAVLNEEEIRKHCQDNLAKYKVPGYIQLINDLPRLATGKVDRKRLKEMS